MISELGGNIIPVIAITCTFLFFTIWVVADFLYRSFRCARETGLKERLVEAGMTCVEIERILNAGTKNEDSSKVHRKPPAGKPAQVY